MIENQRQTKAQQDQKQKKIEKTSNEYDQVTHGNREILMLIAECYAAKYMPFFTTIRFIIASKTGIFRHASVQYLCRVRLPSADHQRYVQAA